MDEVANCQLCGEPFKIGHDSDGREFYLDRRAVTEIGKPEEIKVLCHADCYDHPRIWGRLLALNRRIIELEAGLAAADATGGRA